MGRGGGWPADGARGYSIGQRLVDELLAKANIGQCSDFRETAQTIAKVGFKMFLGVNANVTNMNDEGTEFSLVLEENPLNDFVELPDHLQVGHPRGRTVAVNACRTCATRTSTVGSFAGLWRWSAPAARSADAVVQVNMRVECSFVKDVLSGDDATEIKVLL